MPSLHASKIMMQLIRKLAACATLSTAFLFATPANAFAQATPIANGHVKGGPTISTQEPSIIDLTFNLVELPDGSLVGSGKLTKKSAQGWIKFDVTSYVVLEDGVLMAGPVTALKVGNEPSPWSVGNTFFVFIHDGETPSQDRFIEGRVPPQFGPLTAQQIAMLLGSPPPAIYRQALSGNLVIH